MTLEDKLRELLWHYHDFAESQPSTIKDDTDAIAQIKQAFAAEGYVDVHSHGGLKATTYVDKEGATTWMTGQEWYDRFQKELALLEPLMWMASEDVHKVTEAAKRASR